MTNTQQKQMDDEWLSVARDLFTRLVVAQEPAEKSWSRAKAGADTWVVARMKQLGWT